ncbi:MAG: hypothetical protein ABIP90_09295 [Vicinamibacterales bacterium]
MRRYFVAVIVFALCTAPLRAELKVTSRMVARQVANAPAGNDMVAATVGPMLTQMYGGTEGVEMTLTLHEDGRMRTDYVGAFAGMPAGAVVLMRTDGTSVGFDAKAQTWWKMVDPAAGLADMMAQLKPEVTTKRTGESAQVAGLKAERISMNLRMALPRPPGTENLPPEILAMIPSELKMEGDMWVAPVHAKYMKSMLKALSQGPMAGMGLEKMMGDVQGLTVRQVMRLSILAGYELETLVSKVVEEDVPDSVFDLPTAYKEIPMPTGSGKLPAV